MTTKYRFAAMSACLGWLACTLADVAAGWHWYTIGLSAFNAAWWFAAWLYAGAKRA